MNRREPIVRGRIGRHAWPALLGAALLATTLAPEALPAEPAAAPDPEAVVSAERIRESLRRNTGATRGITLRGLRRTAAAESEGTVNLRIPFEYNSSRLQSGAATQLRNLTEALNSDELRTSRFEVAGHTDARGDPGYNKRLSLKRAESVKQFLVGAGVAPGRIDTVGYGSERPLDAGRPGDATNRRVEIRNLGEGPGNR